MLRGIRNRLAAPRRDPFRVSFLNTWDRSSAERLRVEVERADRMGMRPNIFGKAGDSNIGAYNAFYGLGCRVPVWDRYQWLEPTLTKYREVSLPPGTGPSPHVPSAENREPWNSFSRKSAATHSGIVGSHVLIPSSEFEGLPGWLPDPECPPGQSMLSFEIELLKPRYVFVMFGTNGSSFGFTSQQTADHVGVQVDAIRELGPVPIVCTIPPQLDRAELGIEGRWEFAKETSAFIAEVAHEKGAPLFDQWQALADDRLVNHGMIEYDLEFFDGFHLETPGGFRAPDSLQQTVDFRPEALLYGNNLRNLLILRTLQALDAAVDPTEARPAV